MAKKIKILHIWWSGGVGGAERFIKDIIIYSDKGKFENTVCFLSKRGRYAEEIEKNGGRVYCLGMRNGMDLFHFLFLLKVLHKTQPDIVVTHGETPYLNILLLFYRNISKLYFEHGGSVTTARALWFCRLYWRFYDRILVNSFYTKNIVLDYSPALFDKVNVFYIGVDLRDYDIAVDVKSLRLSIGINSDSKIIGMVGRLVEQKGVDDFIKTASHVNDLLKGKCVFVIVGDGPLRQSLEKLANNLNVPVIFLGERADVPVLLKTFDIFLFTSKWESFGITLLEALSTGIPVVGFAVGGAREIIEKGGGILIDGRDHAILARAVTDVLNSTSAYNELVKEGKQNVSKHFNIINNIKKLETIFAELV